MFDFSFFGLSVYGIKERVALATFFRHCFICISSVKLLQNLRLLQELTLYYYYLNFFPLTQRKIASEKGGTQSRISLFWRHKGRCPTGTLHFTQCANFSTTSQTYLSLLFSNDRWNQTAPFLDNSQVVLNNWSLWKAGNYCFTSNKLQSILHAILTRNIYTLIFAASFECPDSTTLTGKNRSYTTF